MTKTHEYTWEIYYILNFNMPSLCLPYLGSPSVCIISETKFILVCSSSVPFGIYSVTSKHPMRSSTEMMVVDLDFKMLK